MKIDAKDWEEVKRTAENLIKQAEVNTAIWSEVLKKAEKELGKEIKL